MTRPYHLTVATKHKGRLTESEIAELREKYKKDVSPEMIDHVADTLAQAWIDEGKEMKDEQ